MAEFVGEGVEQAGFVVDDFLCEFDGRGVDVDWRTVTGFACGRTLPLPGCTSCGGVQFLAPLDLHAASLRSYFGQASVSDLRVELIEEVASASVL